MLHRNAIKLQHQFPLCYLSSSHLFMGSQKQKLFAFRKIAIQRVFFFFNSTLECVFTLVSSLFVWYTSPLADLNVTKKEHNRQSRKPSASVISGTQRENILSSRGCYLLIGRYASQSPNYHAVPFSLHNELLWPRFVSYTSPLSYGYF